MTKIIHDIINKNFSGAEKLVRENLEYIAERKIIEMKKMIAAKNVIKEESAIFELDTSNMRRSDNVEDRRDEVLKMPDDPIRDLINSTNKSKNIPDETPNDRVKGGFDAMFNPNNVNRDSKGDRDQLKEKAPPGAKYERMVKHIKAKYAKNGLTDKEKSIAYATAWKAKNSTMEEEDSAGDESSMARSELMALTKDAKNIMSKIKGNKELEAWTQSKITKAADYMNSVSDYMQDNDQIDENVDYKMSYIKSHPKHVEIHHVTMSGHDNPHKTPERAKQQVLSNPKHKELKNQGYSIHSYGKHSEPTDYYTRPVEITKEKKSLDEALPKVYGSNKLVARKRMEADRARQKRPMIKVSTDKDIGYKISDIGPGQKEHNTKTHNWNVKEETLDEARFKIVRARIRNGVVQRRKKVSTAPGLTFRGGKLTRMSPAERRHRKMGQRRGKLKRRAKLSRTLRKRTMSLRKRSRLGIK